jgi:putative membrane protein
VWQGGGAGTSRDMRSFAIATMIVVLSTGAALSASPGHPTQFLNSAGGINSAEIAMGKFILQKSNNQVARSYAQRMIQDHSSNQAKLRTLAAKEGVTLTVAVPAPARQEMSQLGKWSGNQLAAAYIANELSDHRQAIALFQQAANDFPAGAVSNYIKLTLPMLNEHLKLAQADSSKIP